MSQGSLTRLSIVASHSCTVSSSRSQPITVVPFERLLTFIATHRSNESSNSCNYIYCVFSCDNTSLLAKGALPGEAKFEVKKIVSCCGCSASYYNLYQRRKLIEQIVYNYNCPGGSATKFLFNYNKRRIVSSET